MEVLKARTQKNNENFFPTNFIFTRERERKKNENKENDRKNLNGIK